MSSTIGRIGVDLTAETATFQTNIERARRSLKQATDGMSADLSKVSSMTTQLGSAMGALSAGIAQAVNASMGFSGVAASLGAATRSAGALGAALAVVAVGAAGITTVARAGDDATRSLQVLQQATGSVAGAADVYESLYRLSLQTGAAVNESAGAFSRFSVAARQIGATNDDVLRLIQTIQQAGIISGASTQEVATASQQLGQALASGVLQGDELRSLLENMPPLAEALARELGVSVGELRKLGSEGKLTADVVLPALLRAGERINTEFAKLPPTMGIAFGQLGSAMSRFLGDLDRAVGLSAAIARTASNAARGLDGLRQSAGFGTAEEGARARVAAAQSAIGAIDGREAESGASGRRGNTQGFARQRAAATAELEAANRALEEIERESLVRRLTERETAAVAALNSQRARNQSELTELQRRYDREGEIVRKSNEALATVREGVRLGNVTESEAATRVSQILAERTRELNALQGAATGAARAQRAVIAPPAEQFGPGGAEALAAQRAQFSEVSSLLESLRTPEEARAARLERFNELLTAGALTQDEYNRAVAAQAPATEAAANGLARFGDIAASAFEDAVLNGKSLRDVMQGLLKDIGRLILRNAVLTPLSGAINSGIGSLGLGEAASGVFANAFGGARAAGGPVSPSSWYLVGENGPEMFRPSAAGSIVPNDEMGGMGRGGQSVTVNINSPDVDGFMRNRQQVAASVGDAVRRGGRIR